MISLKCGNITSTIFQMKSWNRDN